MFKPTIIAAFAAVTLLAGLPGSAVANPTNDLAERCAAAGGRMSETGNCIYPDGSVEGCIRWENGELDCTRSDPEPHSNAYVNKLSKSLTRVPVKVIKLPIPHGPMTVETVKKNKTAKPPAAVVTNNKPTKVGSSSFKAKSTVSANPAPAMTSSPMRVTKPLKIK